MHNDINWYDITEYKSCNPKWNASFVKDGERLNMSYKLIVEDYGKIEKAELEIKPLTLFVGDNNSGKSYLLSLIWAIMSERENHILYRGLKQVLVEKHYDFYSKFLELLENYDFNDENDCVVIEESELENIINDLFALNKDKFVKSIFNYEEMSIGQLRIMINENRRFEILKIQSDTEHIKLSLKVDGIRKMDMLLSKKTNMEEIILVSIVRSLINIIIINDINMNGTYYLPAARTGFMLAKNIINQVGRKAAFDFVVETDEYDNIEMSPLPKPIIHFLDAIDNLNIQFNNEKHAELVNWIVHNMVNGTIECVDNNSGNIQYIPEGMKKGIPLRATSGVVTELTPLILLLKYIKILKTICYEEPEMCLHPQLQFKMAKLILRMVNSGINIVASTHSDLIVQHINNMCRLYSSYNENIELEKMGLDKDDMMDIDKVAVYQFTDHGNKTSIERILPIDNEFNIDSFTYALKKILDQTIEISDMIDGEGE